MAYAKLDEDKRIIFWSKVRLDADMIEFANGDYIDETCKDGLEDYVIEDGQAIYQPLPEKEIEALKKKLSDTDYVAAKIAEGAATRDEYAGLISQRQKWRDRINALRGGE